MGNTFLFNLLMSRGWPPQPRDAQLAHTLCQELGLGELLQGADLIILDESFADLDPKTLQCTMACVREHAPALLVMAHP